MRRPADSWRPVCRELLLLKALLSNDFEDSKANRAAQNKVGHGFISSFRALFIAHQAAAPLGGAGAGAAGGGGLMGKLGGLQMLDEWTTPQFFVVTKQIDGLRLDCLAFA